MPGVRWLASGESRVASGAGQGARANRHWTDREAASFLMGEIGALERLEVGWRSFVRGLGLLALLVVLIVLGMAL